jgi:hypothetical protein
MARLDLCAAARSWQILKHFIGVGLVCFSFHANPICRAQESRLVASSRAQEAEQRIRSALRQVVSWNFQDVPLKQVVEELRRGLGINVVIDVNGLKNSDLPTDIPITARFQDVSGESALDAMLHRSHLDWLIDREMLLITSEDAAKDHVVTRVYPVRDLVQPPSKTNPDEDSGALINVIESTVAAPTWDQVGGMGTAEYYSAAGTLVVTQMREVHDQIEPLLTVLRQLRDEQGISPHARSAAPTSRPHSIAAASAPTRQYAAVPSWNQPRLHQ